MLDRGSKEKTKIKVTKSFKNVFEKGNIKKIKKGKQKKLS
jgi:hypothetical protein